MRQLRVGVIGLGVGEQHLIGYDRNSRCQVAVACDRDQTKLSEIRKRFPNLRAVDSAEELLDDPNIDVISIASHDGDHFDQLCRALDAGKHAFVEKPLCQTFEQLKTIKSKWLQHRGQIKIKSNLVLRGAPLYRWAKQQVQSGQFGRIYSFDGDYLYGRLPKITDGWRAEVENYSVIEGGGIHLVDLAVWITGQRPETIQTIGNRVATANTSFRYHDYATATMCFPSGMIARISANFGCVHGHQHVVRVFGTDKTLLYDDQGPRLQSQRDPAPPATRLAYDALPDSKYVLIDGFVDAITGNQDLSDDTQVDFDVMSICIASDRSLHSGINEHIRYV